MKSVAMIISVLIVASTLAAADPTWRALDFSLVSPSGVAVFGAGSSVGMGLSLVQPGRRTDAGSGYGDGIVAGLRTESGPAPLAAPGQFCRQSLQTSMITKASGSTLLIIGAAMFAGGVILIAETKNTYSQLLGVALVAGGGVTIYKGIEVLISSSGGRREMRGHGGLQVALRVSF